MKHARIHDINRLSGGVLTLIYSEAIFASYRHDCDKYTERHDRENSDIGFGEAVDGILNDKEFRHITILYRDIVNEHFDMKHWEFGMTSKTMCLNIKVRPDLAEAIFKKYELTVIEY